MLLVIYSPWLMVPLEFLMVGSISNLSIHDFFHVQGKQIKAVDLNNKTIVALYDIDGSVYCSEANSTAYQFPITNAKIIQSRALIELCHPICLITTRHCQEALPTQQRIPAWIMYGFDLYLVDISVTISITNSFSCPVGL